MNEKIILENTKLTQRYLKKRSFCEIIKFSCSA